MSGTAFNLRTNAARIRILLVDDHPVMRAGLRALLATEPDFEVAAEASDGVSAVELARQIRPDVVLLDVSLPKLGGAEAAAQILELRTGARILAVTAHEDQGYARTLLDAGASGYALKRSACDELVRAIRVVATGDTYVDPTVVGALLNGSPSSRRRSPASGVPVATLSAREAEVVRLTARGHTSKEMGQALGLSPRTLETYKARAMTKLSLRSRADLIRYAMRCGWLRDV